MWKEFILALCAVAFTAATAARLGGAENFAPLCNFEKIEDWRGFEQDREHVKRGKVSAKWSNMHLVPRVASPAILHDWTKFNCLKVWIYSEKAVDTAFMIIAHSENPETRGGDYYGFKVPLNFAGWKEFTFRIKRKNRFISGARSPLGFDKIQKITFTALGWGNQPNPDAVVYIDQPMLAVEPEPQGPITSDAEFFDSLDLSIPALSQVKAACEAGDFRRAKVELLKYMRSRGKPKWFFDWRERPRDIKPVSGGSEGWDYYSYCITVDWTGWKHFTLKKSQFSSVRKPIGWQRINYIRFSASGWGHTPDPKLILHLDDLKLTGKQEVLIADFETDDDFEYLEGAAPSTEFAESGKRSAKWQNMHLNTSLTLRGIPHDWSDYDALDFYLHSNAPTGARIQIVLESDMPNTKRVDETIMKHIVRIPFPDYPEEVFLGEKIDWEMNPVDSKEPQFTREWTYSLNRFPFWRALGKAYWATGDEKYAKEWVEQMTSWVRDEPVEYDAGAGSTLCWRTIECGIRMSTSWMDAYHYFLSSPSFTPEAHCIFLKSVREHAKRLHNILLQHPERTGNWLTMECNGLAHVAIMFPEFKESKEWLKTAFDRLTLELDRQVYPDGCQIELTTGYHLVCIRNFLGAVRIARLNDVPVPEGYMKKLEGLYNCLLYVMMPDGTTPPLNDGSRSNVRRYLAEAARFYNRPDFEWAGSNGARGKKPDETSRAFRWGGQYVMRSGWDKDDLYLILDAGPYGAGHQHEDCLSVYAYAYGRVLITEPGNYAYNQSKWRRFVLSTAAHNTILVDGEGQHRKGLRETYITKTPLPNRWFTSHALDYAEGKYDCGYGEKRDKSVTHYRKVVFVRPLYWIVYDVLEGKGRHRFDSLFHLDADDARIDEHTKAVRTVGDESSNILIVPLPDEALSVEIVKGREEPVQGWIPSRKRAIPTAIYTKNSECPTTFVHVLFPYRGAEAPRVEVEKIPLRSSGKAVRPWQAVGLRIIHDDGSDIVMIRHSAERQIEFDGYITDALVARVELDRNGNIQRGSIVGGNFLRRNGKSLLPD